MPWSLLALAAVRNGSGKGKVCVRRIGVFARTAAQRANRRVGLPCDIWAAGELAG